MATVTQKGNPIEVAGTFPAVGASAPAFRLVGKDLKDDKVLHAQLVPETSNEPEYAAAVAALT